jgi:hypothetical protein
MKTLLSVLFFCFSLCIWAQAPQSINYQGVARNTSGAPIVGPIAVRVQIHQGGPNGAVVCSEVFHISTNQFGIFDLRIGTVSPGQFTVIPWGLFSYFAAVAIDPTGGNTFGSDITNQQLVSVPYALYAEKAGNAGGSTTVVSTSDAITISGTSPSFTVGYQPPILVLVNDTILSIKQGTYNSTPVILKSGVSATATPFGPWTANSGSVQLAVSNDRVGIGAVPAFAKLDVVSTTTTGVFVSSPATGILAVTGSSSFSNHAIYGNNQGGANSGTGVTGISSSSFSAAVMGQNTGSGIGVSGIANSTASPGVYGVNNGGAVGVFGEVTNTSASNNANGVYGKTGSGSNLASGVYGLNVGAGNGVYGLASSTNNISYGVYGKHIGGGTGVYGESSSSINTIGAVTGMHFGTGPALKGSLPSGTIAGGSNAALLVENGHIKAVGPTPSVGITFNNLTTGTVAISPNGSNNDVRGVLVVNSNITGTGSGTYLELTVTFTKPYPTIPTVVVSQFDQTNFVTTVSQITNTNFIVRIANKTAGTLPASQFKATYIVIE